MGDEDTWIDVVLNNRGEHCKNCDTWRSLRGGLWLEQCPSCGDEEIEIYEAEFNAEQLP